MNFSLNGSQLNGSAMNATEAPSRPTSEPQPSQIFRLVLFSLITLASLVGNLVVCKAIDEVRSRMPLSYYLVANLAVAEIVNTLCLPFMFAYPYLGHWPFGEFACTFIMPLQHVSMFVVTNTLAAIAVYRYGYDTFHPIIRALTNRKMLLVLVLLWVDALVVCLPLFIHHKIYTYKTKDYCSPEFTGDDAMVGERENQKKYMISRFVLNFVVPCLIMLMSYGAVALKLKNYVVRTKSIEMSELGPTMPTTQENPPPDNAEQNTTALPPKRKSSRGIMDLENDLIRMMYAVILVFVVCYIPFQVHYLFLHFGGYELVPELQEYQSIIVRYMFILTCLPSALHPLCYGTMSKFYAKSFARLVLCRNRFS